MSDRVELFHGDLIDGGMSMPTRDGGDARDKINVSLASVVVQILHMTFNYEQRFLIVVEIKIRHPSFPVLDDLFIGRTVVRSRLMVDIWEVELACCKSGGDSSKHRRYFD